MAKEDLANSAHLLKNKSEIFLNGGKLTTYI